MIKKYKKYLFYVILYLLLFVLLYVILYFGSIQYINNLRWNNSIIAFLSLFFLFLFILLIAYLFYSIHIKISSKNYLSNEINYKKFKKLIKVKRLIFILLSIYLVNSIILVFEFFIISFSIAILDRDLLFLDIEIAILSILSAFQILYILINLISDLIVNKRNKEIPPLKYIYLWNSKDYIIMRTIYSTFNLFIAILLFYLLLVDFGEKISIGIWSFFPIWYGFVLRDLYKKYKLLSKLIYLKKINNNVDMFIKTLMLSNKNKEDTNIKNNFLDKLLDLDLIKQFENTFFFDKIKIYLNLAKNYSEDSDEFILITGMLFLYIYQLYSDNNDNYFFTKIKRIDNHFINDNFVVYNNKKPINLNKSIYGWFNKEYKENNNLIISIKSSFYKGKNYDKYNIYLIRILYWVIISASNNPFEINDMSFNNKDKLINPDKLSKYFHIKIKKLKSQMIIDHEYLNYWKFKKILKHRYSNINIFIKKTIFVEVIKDFIEYKCM